MPGNFRQYAPVALGQPSRPKLTSKPTLLTRATRKLRNLYKNAGVYGILEFAIKERFWILTAKFLGNRYSRKHYTLGTRFSPAPMLLRSGTSDRAVFNQVLVYEGYDLFEPSFEPEFIIDAGANVGMTAAYFLSRYPKARLAAIEPDRGNFEMLLKNTAQFRDRVACFNSGLWPYCTGLKVMRGEFADGREWSIQVRPVKTGEAPDLEAIDMQTVLAKANFPRVDLLKIDIERAEQELFSHCPLAWLDRVKVIAIELHGADCEKVFHEALNPRKYTSKVAGETTVVTFQD